MERGLLWLPLLALFLGLAWAGWVEYQKVEAYQVWAKGYDRAKYDIYAVLGQSGDQLVCGKPTRQGPTDLVSFSLSQVQALELIADNQLVRPESLPTKASQIFLRFILIDVDPVLVPFTDLEMAARWFQHLQATIATLEIDKGQGEHKAE